MSLAVSDEGLRLTARDEDLAAQCAGYSLTELIHFFHYSVTKFICQLLNSTFFKIFYCDFFGSLPRSDRKPNFLLP